MTSLSLEFVIAFDPIPFLDPDVGNAYDLVPEAAGVIAFLNDDGSAIRIFEHNCLRQLVIDAHSGYEGGDILRASHVGFELCADPAVRVVQLLDEHQRVYGRLPARISA